MTDKVKLTTVTAETTEPEEEATLSEDEVEAQEENELEEVLREEKGGSWFGRFVLFAVIIGLLVTVGKLTNDINLLKQNLEPEAFLKQDNLLLEDISKQQKSLTTQIKLLAQQQETLETSLKAFQTDLDDVRSTRSQGTSLLNSQAEYNFLIERADFKLSYEHDPSGAIAILKLLAGKANPELQKATQSTIDEISPFTKVETPMLLDKLEILELSISKLPLTLKTQFEKPKEQATPEESNIKEKAWKEKLLASIKEVVVIQRVDQPVKPLLNQHEKALLLYQLKLKMQQAKMALLTHQYGVFVERMKAIRADLQPYVDFKTNKNISDLMDDLIQYPFPGKWPKLDGLKKIVNKQGKVSKP